MLLSLNQDIEAVFKPYGLVRARGLESTDAQIRGTCTTFHSPSEIIEGNWMFRDPHPTFEPSVMIKASARSSAGYTPSHEDIRTPETLTKCLGFICTDLLDRDDEDAPTFKNDLFTFVEDRLRAIRKDYVSQAIQDTSHLDAIVIMLRIHLLRIAECSCTTDEARMYDRYKKLNSERLTDCFGHLLQYYRASSQAPNCGEVFSYLLLTALGHDNEDSALWWNDPALPLRRRQMFNELTRCMGTDLKSSSVLAAMRTVSTLETSHWAQFCDEVKLAPFLQACLMFSSLAYVRVRILQDYICARVPNTKSARVVGTLPLETLQSLMIFDTREDLESFLSCFNINYSDGIECGSMEPQSLMLNVSKPNLVIPLDLFDEKRCDLSNCDIVLGNTVVCEYPTGEDHRNSCLGRALDMALKVTRRAQSEEPEEDAPALHYNYNPPPPPPPPPPQLPPVGEETVGQPQEQVDVVAKPPPDAVVVPPQQNDANVEVMQKQNPTIIKKDDGVPAVGVQPSSSSNIFSGGAPAWATQQPKKSADSSIFASSSADATSSSTLTSAFATSKERTPSTVFSAAAPPSIVKDEANERIITSSSEYKQPVVSPQESVQADHYVHSTYVTAPQQSLQIESKCSETMEGSQGASEGSPCEPAADEGVLRNEENEEEEEEEKLQIIVPRQSRSMPQLEVKRMRSTDVIVRAKKHACTSLNRRHRLQQRATIDWVVPVVRVFDGFGAVLPYTHPNYDEDNNTFTWNLAVVHISNCTAPETEGCFTEGLLSALDEGMSCNMLFSNGCVLKSCVLSLDDALDCAIPSVSANEKLTLMVIVDNHDEYQYDDFEQIKKRFKSMMKQWRSNITNVFFFVGYGDVAGASELVKVSERGAWGTPVEWFVFHNTTDIVSVAGDALVDMAKTFLTRESVFSNQKK